MVTRFYPWFGAGIASSENRTATDLKVRRSNPGGDEIFRTCPGRPWGPFSFLSNGYRISFPGVKRPWNGVDHLPPSCAEAKEWAQLHLFSPSGPSWAVIRWTLPFTFITFVFGWQWDQAHWTRNDDVVFTMSDMIRWRHVYDGRYSMTATQHARCVVYRSVGKKKHRHRCTNLATEGVVSRNYEAC